MNIRRTLVALLFLLLHISAFAVTEAELIHHTDDLYRTLSTGDRRPWEAYIADDVLFFSEKGYPMDKKALLEDVAPFPMGYTGNIVLQNVHSYIADSVAILSYDANETETVYGQELHARYHETDTWLLRNGKWQIAAGQVLRYYDDPMPGVVDPGKLDDYTGTYSIAPGQILTVTREKNTLFIHRSSAANPVELVVEANEIFFRRGVEGRIVFHRDSAGHVDSLINRRNNEDLTWKRVD